MDKAPKKEQNIEAEGRETKMLEANKVVEDCIADLEKYRPSLQEQFDRILRKSGVDNPLRIEDIPIVKRQEALNKDVDIFMRAQNLVYTRENKHQINVYMPSVIHFDLRSLYFKESFLGTYIHELCHVYSTNKKVKGGELISASTGYSVQKYGDVDPVHAGLNEGMTELIAEHIYIESKIRDGNSSFSIRPTYRKDRMRVRKIIKILSKFLRVSEDLVFEAMVRAYFNSDDIVSMFFDIEILLSEKKWDKGATVHATADSEIDEKLGIYEPEKLDFKVYKLISSWGLKLLSGRKEFADLFK